MGYGMKCGKCAMGWKFGKGTAVTVNSLWEENGGRLLRSAGFTMNPKLKNKN